ncbi:MAG: MBL fold metallo-hydrolase [Lachnospiraceae bacterium]|nr:MBL fold metallo-hydrolase [Lachnospiraceae bacterium]
MRIITLVENMEGLAGCGTEHGLSFYIETEAHRLLFDAGASELVMKNSAVLGVDLTAVDTAFLSHGHSDHGGGLPAFLAVNDRAKVYLLKSMFEGHYSLRADGPHYIGLPEALRQYNERLVCAGEKLDIDPELSVFSGIGYQHPMPPTNGHLMMDGADGLVRDDFAHEMCLVISQGEKRYLFSGCAHHGVLNVLERFAKLYGGMPDAVFGGFHLMRHGVPYGDADRNYAEQTAEALTQLPAQFYTCHCTGEEPYAWMKAVMGEQLHYLHCGESVTL